MMSPPISFSTNLAIWLGIALYMLFLFGPDVYLERKIGTIFEDDLVALSSAYEGIWKRYLKFSVLWYPLFALLILIAFVSEHYVIVMGGIFMPSIKLIPSLFALKTGAYPILTRSLGRSWYIYEEDPSRIRRFSRWQIIIYGATAVSVPIYLIIQTLFS